VASGRLPDQSTQSIGVLMCFALWVKIVGSGSQYGFVDHDAAGRYLDGGKNCRLHLPSNIMVD
jgi:hypothetical protein